MRLNRNESDIVNSFQRKSMSARDDKFTSAREWITVGHRKSKIFAVDRETRVSQYFISPCNIAAVSSSRVILI